MYIQQPIRIYQAMDSNHLRYVYNTEAAKEWHLWHRQTLKSAEQIKEVMEGEDIRKKSIHLSRSTSFLAYFLDFSFNEFVSDWRDIDLYSTFIIDGVPLWLLESNRIVEVERATGPVRQRVGNRNRVDESTRYNVWTDLLINFVKNTSTFFLKRAYHRFGIYFSEVNA